MMRDDAPPLVLASASTARQALLQAAGLRFTVERPDVDEGAVKFVMHNDGAAPEAVALVLAAAKASAVEVPGALVIGADQILVCNGEWFDKPADTDAALEHLLRLRGHPHTLITAICCWQDGKALWQSVSHATLTMRAFSTEFLEAYLAAEGEACLGCVGAYRYEGLGQHLFERVEGEHASILGLPMAALLAFLRERRVLIT